MKANYCLVKMKSRGRADCSVLAAQMSLGLAYQDAEARLAEVGRKPGRRVPGRIFEKLGLVQRPDLACRSVISALAEMQEGRFVVFVTGHFFAVVDGRMFDSQFTRALARVRMVYQVPLDNPEVLARYPYLEKITALDKLPDMRGINCN